MRYGGIGLARGKGRKVLEYRFTWNKLERCFVIPAFAIDRESVKRDKLSATEPAVHE